MSWGGPVAGATPYPQPPYANGPVAFGQPQTFQYSQSQAYGQYQPSTPFPQQIATQRPTENRPPKKKGNPIITRYPPPPGYRGPAQPAGPFGSNQYPNQFQQPSQVPSSYPNQGYQGPPAAHPYAPQSYGTQPSHPQQPPYSQSNHPQASTYGWSQQPQQPQQPQQVYGTQTGYSQPSSYPNGQGYAPVPNTYQGYPQQAAAGPSQQAYPQAQGWQQPSTQATWSTANQYNSFGLPVPNAASGLPDLNATPTPSSVNPVASQTNSAVAKPEDDSSTSAEKPPLFLAWDDWDFDFDGAIWPKANEPVDPNLSLGVIIWRPAKQVTRALPSTFAEAEEQALKPPAEKLGNGESVSIYFTPENSHEAFLDVRQTDDWEKIKNDPIFVVFTDYDLTQNLISIQECIDLRERPDEPPEQVNEQEDEEMHDSSWNVMDNLEQALSAGSGNGNSQISRQDTGISRDQTQEDILARLGVTGSPKPPSNEPIALPFPITEKPPASLPPKPPAPLPTQIPPRPEQPPQRAHSYSAHYNPPTGLPPQRTFGSVSSSTNTQPAFQERQRFAPTDNKETQYPFNSHAFDGSRESPARSEASNHTLAGSDFETVKPTGNISEKAAAPVPSLTRSDSSRKRSYEDTDQEDEKLRQQDDHSKRKRRSQVAAAYSRR